MNDKWKEGEIIEKHDTPRSFVIQSEGRCYRRNTKHIRNLKKENKEIENTVDKHIDPASHKVTRSGRIY